MAALVLGPGGSGYRIVFKNKIMHTVQIPPHWFFAVRLSLFQCTVSRACFPDPGENHGLVRTRIHNTGITIYILLIVSLLLKIERLVTELQQCGGSGSEWFRNIGLELDPT